MTRQRYPYAKVGGPVSKPKSVWNVLKVHSQAKLEIGLIQRVRKTAHGTDLAYAVVRSQKPIVANGTMLNALEAVAYRNQCGRICKARDPQAWHSSFQAADAKFQRRVLRGWAK